MRTRRPLATLAATAALVLSGCTLDPTSVPLPGGADVGDEPFEVTVEFRDVLDLVPQSAVRVDDIAVGRVIDIKLKGWTAQVTVLVNGDVELPDNAEATIRQSSLLGEKFVSLDAPASGAATGELSDGDSIPLERSGRNPEVEEVLGAASLLFNGGGLEKTNIIVTELNKAVTGNETEIKQLLQSSTQFLGQIDTNKDALLGALEKVDNLAVTANAQEAALTSALDNLPEALTVLDQQRDDLVRLTTALQELGDTATGVIAASREATTSWRTSAPSPPSRSPTRRWAVRSPQRRPRWRSARCSVPVPAWTTPRWHTPTSTPARRAAAATP
jgi:virulence factor Mce-like protein